LSANTGATYFRHKRLSSASGHFTSEFGMESGGTTPAKPPYLHSNNLIDNNYRPCGFKRSNIDQLVLLSSTPCGAYT